MGPTLSSPANRKTAALASPFSAAARRNVILNAYDRWNAAAQNSPAGVRYAQIRPFWYFR